MGVVLMGAGIGESTIKVESRDQPPPEPVTDGGDEFFETAAPH